MEEKKKQVDEITAAVRDAVAKVSRAYRPKPKGYVEPILWIGEFEMEIDEFGDERIEKILISHSSKRSFMELLNYCGIDAISCRRGMTKTVVKISTTPQKRARLAWLIEVYGIKTICKQDGMYVRMPSKANVRNVSKREAYGRRARCFYQNIKLAKGEYMGQIIEAMETTIEPMYFGYGLRHMPYLKVGDYKLQASNGTAKLIHEATMSFLTVQFDFQSELTGEVAVGMIDKLYVATGATFNHGFAVGYETYDEETKCRMVYWFDQNGKTSYMHEVKAAIDAGNCRIYSPFVQSPSMTRKGQCLFFDTTHLTDEQFAYVFNECTQGAYGVLTKAYPDPLPAKKSIKMAARWSLTMTGSAHFGTLENFAVFYDDWEIDGVKWQDGHFLISSRFIIESLEARGVHLSYDDAFNVSNQGRMGMIKGFATVDDPEDIKRTIEYLLESGLAYGIKYFSKEELTEELAVRIQKNENDEFSKYILVFGAKDLENIQLFCTTCTLKCMWDLSRPFEYCLMDIPVEPKGHGKTSKQVCNTIQIHPDFLDVMDRLAKESVDRVLDRYADVDSLEYDDNGNPVRVQIGTTDYATSAICQVIPNASDLDPCIRKTQARSTVDALNRMCNKFNFSVRGSNYKVAPDYGGYFGCPLLEEHEVYVAGRKTTGKRIDGVGFRHPLAGIKEHLCIRFVGLSDIIARIQASDMTDEQKETTIRRYRNTMPGIAVVASTSSRLAGFFNGMDYDGDTMLIVEEEEIIRMADDNGEASNNFGEGEAADDKFKLDIHLPGQAFLYQFGLAGKDPAVNPAIGQLAGFDVSVVGLLNLAIRRQVGETWLPIIFKGRKEGR